MQKKTKVDQFKEMMATDKKPENKHAAEAAKVAGQLKAAEEKAKESHDKLLRVMAEFENYKKRIEKESLDHAKYSNQQLIKELFPVFDDLDRVLDHIPEKATQDACLIADGVRLIQNHLTQILAKHGLSQLESSVGKPFNPEIHEAVGHVDSKENKPGTVVSEHRKGWRLHDRIVRAAMVTVAK